MPMPINFGLLGLIFALSLVVPASAGPMEDALAGMRKDCQAAQRNCKIEPLNWL